MPRATMARASACAWYGNHNLPISSVAPGTERLSYGFAGRRIVLHLRSARNHSLRFHAPLFAAGSIGNDEFYAIFLRSPPEAQDLRRGILASAASGVNQWRHWVL